MNQFFTTIQVGLVDIILVLVVRIRMMNQVMPMLDCKA